jgi:hypothetical protein
MVARKKHSALPDEWESKWVNEAASSSDPSDDEEASDSSDGLVYPTINDLGAAGDSEDSDEDNQAFDFDACDLDCGYCGKCAQ